MGTRVMVLSALLLGACTSKEPSKQELCEQLRDHVVDLRVATIPAESPDPYAGSGAGSNAHPGGAPVKADLEGHRAALRQALGTAYVESCTKALSDEQLKCSLAATDGDAVSKCQSLAAR